MTKTEVKNGWELLQRTIRELREDPESVALRVGVEAKLRDLPAAKCTFAVEVRLGVRPEWEHKSDSELAELLDVPEVVLLEAQGLAVDVVKYDCMDRQVALCRG